MEMQELMELLVADAVLTRAFQLQSFAATVAAPGDRHSFMGAHPVTDFVPPALEALQAARRQMQPTAQGPARPA